MKLLISRYTITILYKYTNIIIYKYIIIILSQYAKHTLQTTFATTGSEQQGRFCMTKTLLAIYSRPHLRRLLGRPYIGGQRQEPAPFLMAVSAYLISRINSD